MPVSNWLNDEQLRELVDGYFAKAYHEDSWSGDLRSVVERIRQEVFNTEALDMVSDEVLLERLISIYRTIVKVPLYYKAITGHPGEVRAALRYLLESDDEITVRVDALMASDGAHYIKGLGKAFWSAFLMALDPARNPYWNNKTESALAALGMANWSKRDSPGQVYRHVTEAEHALVGMHPQADLYAIDHFMHYVTVLEGTKILQEWQGVSPEPAPSDPWADRIARWRRQHLPPERIAVRQEAEGEARQLLEENLGRFDEETLRALFELVNTDLFAGEPRRNRFSPAFVGAYANRIVEQLERFNDWSARLWEAPEADLEPLLDTFWEGKPISYAGTSLPTLILYLREPSRYNIWLDPMTKGLERVLGFAAPRHAGGGYLRYNDAVNEFRHDYDLQPQEVDVLLVIAGKGESPPLPPEAYTFDQLQADTFLDADFLLRVETLLLDKRQIVLYGPPGTGKTFVAKKFARYFVDQTGGEVQIVQFHPSYGYEEFVEGIRPRSDDGQLTYPIEWGVFRHLCKKASEDPESSYVLIVDEINRGNLPRILGELLYLLEYRDDVEPVVLPYSQDEFSIPPNLYLIGTMNTADRSIALVDHALRRRFHFIPLKPSPEILRAWLEAQGREVMVWVADLLSEVNRRLQQDQIDWHLHIGHSHWMVRSGQLDEERATLVWDHSIRPTLEEYFYKQPERLARYDYESLRALLTGGE